MKKTKETLNTEEQNKRIETWISNLLSGNFRQGVGKLHTVRKNGEEFFCCLGVGCVVAMENGVKLPVWGKRLGRAVAYGRDGTKEFLPEEVAEYFGFNQPGGDFHTPFPLFARHGRERGKVINVSSLAEANDAGATFEEIVEIVRSRKDEIFSLSLT